MQNTRYRNMISARFKRSAFHRWFGLSSKADRLAVELQELLNQRLQLAEDTIQEAKQILADLRAIGHRLSLSESDSDADIQVWMDGDFAVWFWADSDHKDVNTRIDRIEILWQKM